MHLALNAWFGDNPAVGSGQYLKYLLPALLEADADLNITLISPKPLPTASGQRLNIAVVPTAWPNQTSHVAKVWFEQITFPRACRRLGAEVAHVPYFGSPLSPTIPTVVTIHDIIPLVLPEYRGGARVRLYSSLVAAAASQARLILADSVASQQDIFRKLHVPPAQVRVVYLAPAPHFRLAQSSSSLEEDKEKVRQKYHLPERFVLYLGGYDVRKNMKMLLKAFTWVNRALGNEYPLVLAGSLPRQDTPFFPDPRRIAHELGIESALLIPGRIAEEDLPLLYALATVFVYPSRYEGFGLPILETMACGTPVVTTNAASLPELAGGAAFQLDPDDAEHFAAAIIRLCIDEDFHEELRQRGLAQVKQFSWENTAQQTLQAYQGIGKNVCSRSDILV